MALKKKSESKKKNLVIVESPSKAKTIGKFLGSTYKVVASVGHIRDLPKSKIGIDVENDFEPQYINVRGKGDIIKELKKEAKKSKKIFLATDPDREGEAISWHLAHILDIDRDEKCRIVFNEITKEAVKSAIKQPRTINQDLVDAQQARRVLDRLVGYSISPLLWRKIRTGLSAGRVQSVALKMICDREAEIEKFQPTEFWHIAAQLSGKKVFEAKLRLYEDEKITVPNEQKAKEIEKALNENKFIVCNIEESDRQRKPYAPYTTSSMQQDCANKLNFGTKKTMQIAQQLYEGIDIKGRGTVGLVSYIRTDSTRLSQEARDSAKRYIMDNFGEKYYSGNIFGKNKKDAQDAHEAIRPSYVDLTPEIIKESLTKDQYKLYLLIWSRFIASQMASAVYKSMIVDIKNGSYTFRANGSTMMFDGHLKVYNLDKSDDKILPHVIVGEELKCNKIIKEQSFTQPPARYTEAGLVKSLEELGIGRPSTYAPIVTTLLDRRYVKKDKRSFVPTELGNTVSNLMGEYFKNIVDSGFTADMEERLDKVGNEIHDWKSILREFYIAFEKDLENANENIQKLETPDEITDVICDKCGSNMVKKHGRFGEFLACSAYPECKNTQPIVKEIGVPCPKCDGQIIEKKSRRGKMFYGCSNYPTCEESYWTKPTGEKCPECGSMLVEKINKNFDGVACSNEQCSYKRKKEE